MLLLPTCSPQNRDGAILNCVYNKLTALLLSMQSPETEWHHCNFFHRLRKQRVGLPTLDILDLPCSHPKPGAVVTDPTLLKRIRRYIQSPESRWCQCNPRLCFACLIRTQLAVPSLKAISWYIVAYAARFLTCHSVTVGYVG